MSLLPLLFVGLGVVLLLAAWAVWHQGRRIRECVRDLLALPDDMHPMDWPQRASTVLRRAGIGGMAWRGQWFGDPVQGHWGQPAQPDWTHLSLDAGPDCRIELSWAGLARTNEAKALALVVVDVFVQSWLSRMRERTQAVAVALAQRAHVHLYWQHDMRNLAQWVGLMADEFGSASPEKLPRLAQRLQQQAPLVLAKAKKLLEATQAGTPLAPPPSPAFSPVFTPPPAPMPSPPSPEPGRAAQAEPPPVPPVPDPQPTVPVLGVVAGAAQLAGLSLQCEPAHGTSLTTPHTTALHARALERTLDNIFSNIARDGGARVQGRALRLTWAVQDEQFQARLLTPHLSTPWPERPFEPMQTHTGTGSGLGLYQARRSLRDVGGDLTAQPTPDGIAFEWRVALCAQRQIF
ncbi:MAG: ATP-binding protein [Hydrogenophaga sp.]|nr:ATP-binding protein [Hydrogenophaga sp.]